MKKTLLALASVAALGAAHADVTLYGILDTGVSTQNRGVAADANGGASLTPLPASPVAQNRVTGMFNGGLSPSRWGLKGSDKDSGAFFTLESALNVPFGTNPNGRISNAAYGAANGTGGAAGTGAYISQEGSLDGQMFDREASVGIQMGDLKISGGRQLTITGDLLGAYDTVGAYFSPLGFNGGYAGNGFTAESRWDQSVKASYALNSSTTLLGMYKFGANAYSYTAGSAFEFGVRYQASPTISIAATYAANKDAQLAANGTAVAGSLTESLTFADTHANMVVAQWDATPTLTLKGGLENIVTGNPSNPTYDQTINVLSGVLVNKWNTSNYDTPRQENMYWLTASYDLGNMWKTNFGVYQRNTNAYGTAAQVAACPGTNSTACSTSRAQYLTANLIRSLSKQTDVYGVLSTNNLSGPVWGATTATAILPVTAVGTGIRMKF